jgi:fructose-bisphosphate aldolase / 6-deoxy-5-ketofructose 1-phosphate synthase
LFRLKGSTLILVVVIFLTLEVGMYNLNEKSKSSVPLVVPKSLRSQFEKNVEAIAPSGRLFLFAGDQKMEHLNSDFLGDGISKDDANPVHLFNIASSVRASAFATHLGLISRYADNFRSVQYIVKLSGKTNLVGTDQDDPLCATLNSVEQVVEFKNESELNIPGVGYTVYIGSEYESEMLEEASQIVYDAHRNGLIAILWMYPRGKAVDDELSVDIIAGAAGVGASLGADFIKVNSPQNTGGISSAQLLKHVIVAAGNTKVVCSGGTTRDEETVLKDIHNQIHIGGAGGVAVGRNIHQRDLGDAVKFCKAIEVIVNENKTVGDALEILNDG